MHAITITITFCILLLCYSPSLGIILFHRRTPEHNTRTSDITNLNTVNKLKYNKMKQKPHMYQNALNS